MLLRCYAPGLGAQLLTLRSEISLGMGTCRASSGWLRSLVDITAVVADPSNRLVLLKDGSLLDGRQALFKAAFMVFLRNGNRLQDLGNILKPFLPGDLRILRIHLGPFKILARRGLFQVFS